MEPKLSEAEKYAERGIAFLNGDGAPKDYEQAYYWLSAACELGSGDAEPLLNDMRKRGLGTPFEGELPDTAERGYSQPDEADAEVSSSAEGHPLRRQVAANPDRCIACGMEALGPSSSFAGARYCASEKGGCGSNTLIPIAEQGLDRGVALQPYKEEVDGQRGNAYSSLGGLIHMVKYDERVDDRMRAEIISEIADRIAECGVIGQLTGRGPGAWLVIVPAPSSKRRKVQPVELLARFLSEGGYGFDDVLTKRSSTESKSRPSGTELAPGDVRCKKDLQGASVLLVDDTYGEGATLRACIRALRECGAREVYFLSVCKNIFGGMKGGPAGDDDIH